jgi:arginyl-tRNA--protein-N-Asp/Glu arginylyltransferase
MLRILERPRPCSYLPKERASLEVIFDGQLTPESYGELLRRGYRRFGWQIFRPACPQCQACISLRIPVSKYRLSASDRRIMRKNQHIRCELAASMATTQHVDLYNRYQAFMHIERSWAPQRHSISTYREAFVSGPEQIGFEWRYFEGDRLVGVSLMDQVPGAISLAYFFYDPAWRPHSPGRFSILNQILFAQAQGKAHAYLGYWVEECISLSYKSRFQPHEALQRYVSEAEEPVWQERREASSAKMLL